MKVLSLKLVVPTDTPNLSQFCVSASIHVVNSFFPVSVIVDSGSAGNFISKTLVVSLSIPVENLPDPIPVRAVNG